MKFNLYLFIFFFVFISYVTTSDDSSSFCLCVLKNILKDYALLSTNRIPPRYRSSNSNDIGFYVVPSNWKAVNNATWSELGAMINAPSGMYTHISLDGIHPLMNGLTLDSLRSAHLADILTEYRQIIDQVDIYHEEIIQNRTEKCSEQTNKAIIGFDLKSKWTQFFVPRSN